MDCLQTTNRTLENVARDDANRHTSKLQTSH